VLAVLLCGLAPGLSQARSPRQEAAALARQGEALFREGRYEEARQAFMASYSRFTPEFVIPHVLWNIGRCHEQMGDLNGALRFFEEFALNAETPEFKARAIAKIGEIKDRMIAPVSVKPRPLADEARAGPAAPAHAPPPAPRIAFAPPPPKPAPETSVLKAALFWGGLAAAAAGGGLHAWGSIEWSGVESGKNTYAEVSDAEESATWKYMAGYGLYGAGAAAIVTSFLVGDGEHPLAFGPAPAAGWASVGLAGRM
jgi:tetratricopeptide (TPR) repeat protein